MQQWRDGGFGLYLHWPFCQSKCPYCDFNSHVASHIDESRWAAAFESEIARTKAITETNQPLQSIYFGGGTPSLMSPDLVDSILRAVRKAWSLANDCEITLEANPGSVEAGRFQGFRDAGVNRISMGMQAMNDADLRRLGRMHSAEEAMQAFETARNIFDRVNFDLIYARQNQSLEDWRSELSGALRLGVDHLSMYQLTVEDGTVFGDRFAKGQLRGLPGEALSVAMYELTQDLCDQAGLPAYEVSNHAKAGQESRHNLIYWQGGEYAGIGPGAHGRVTIQGRRTATVGLRAPGAWLAGVEQHGSGDASAETLPPEDVATEYLMMGLRLTTGVSRARFAALGGQERPDRIDELVALNMLVTDRDSLRTTPEGRLLLNEVLRKLLA
ncbi:MAG: coproporphyrinogen oxidase [Pseudomonadota bacterium]|jgi:oxygen-independent coproporphyrinogen-3 oxidase